MNYANVAFSAAISICMLNLLGSAVRGTGNMALAAAVIVGNGSYPRPVKTPGFPNAFTA